VATLFIAQSIKKAISQNGKLLVGGMLFGSLVTFIGIFLNSINPNTHQFFTISDLLVSVTFYVLISVNFIIAMLIRQILITKTKQTIAQVNELEKWAENIIDTNKLELLPENNKISIAINSVLKQLKQAKNSDSRIEQRIRQHPFLDEETGIGNREFFNNRLDAFLAEEDARGTLLLIQVNELEAIEALYGKQQALILLNSVIQTIKKRIQARINYFLARQSEYELALLLPNAYVDETEKLANKLINSLSTITVPTGINSEEFIHIGISCFKSHQKPYQILAEADMALRSAQLHGPSQWFMFERDEIDDESAKGSLRWRTFLQSAIKNDVFVIFFQPVISLLTKDILHFEVFSKIKDKHDQFINARVFLPMAQKCGLSADIDILVIEQVITALNKKTNKLQHCSLNLSVYTLLSPPFIEKFLTKLENNQSLNNRLIIEISEYRLVSQLTELEPVLKKLHASGIKLIVDKVGQYLVNGSYLKELPISAIKLHSSIVLKIHEKTENQIFINSLKVLCDENNVDIYALGVELTEEWQTLIKLGVSGGQGHLFSEPVPELVKTIAQS
jgi:RNase E specificity factor CsrD